MMVTETLKTTTLFKLIIWLVGVSFVLFQFFLQLSSGVIIGHIMHDMSLSALTAGLLSSSFYFVYTVLQIPVGMMFDRKNTRILLSCNALLCSFGCLIFANSTSLVGLFIGRTLIGAGSAFAFVGFSHVLRQYFPPRQFAFMIGFSETLGFIATAIGIVGMGEFIAHWGWRTFIDGAAVMGVLISFLCWKVIPNSTQHPSESHFKQSFIAILSNYPIWLNGFFVGLSFSVVTVFGALWAVPFIQVKLGCSIEKASIIGAIYFIGTGLSCPLFGILSNHVKRRKRLILTSCLTTACLLLLLLFVPMKNLALVMTLMFMIGLFCGAYMLSYTISNELAPPQLQSTAMGFTNTLAVLSALILQPFVGFLLVMSNQTGIYNVTDYQYALLVVPLSLFLASLLVFFLPEK